MFTKGTLGELINFNGHSNIFFFQIANKPAGYHLQAALCINTGPPAKRKYKGAFFFFLSNNSSNILVCLKAAVSGRFKITLHFPWFEVVKIK